ncbi:hypothetical protein GJ496_006328 [Pomphorhynchus laevis]|nr:hypothetical protein GJ496_006328 [Pomphorhynchus laevis]
MDERYGFSLTTFSPTGKLVQIEYALNAVASATPAVAIQTKNGAVIATEKKTSPLADEHSTFKVNSICDNIGVVYSGLCADYRVLLTFARKIAQNYILTYEKNVPPIQLVRKVASAIQEYTQQGAVRPFGVSLLIAGWSHDDNRPYILQCDPSGSYFAWKAAAIGKNFVSGRSFLEKRYSDSLSVEDAVHTAILTLKESFEGQMNHDNIEIGVCTKDGFRRLSPNEIKDYLTSL